MLKSDNDKQDDVPLGVLIKMVSSGPDADGSSAIPNQVSRDRLIVCNGRALHITQNLYNALLLIPASNEELEQYWWIDQVCINQSNVAEKVDQVRKMDEIYSQATNVAAWLGTPWAFERYAPAAILRNYEYDLTTGKDISGRFWLHDWDLIRGWIALLIMFRREWFLRVWCVQEFILAKDVKFFLGKHSMASDDLMAAACRFQKVSDFYHYGSIQIFPTQPIVELHSARLSYNAKEGWSLERWLCLSRGRQATDRRDFLFAGFSLLSQAEKTRFNVDYSKSSQELFVNVTENLLLSDMGVEALCLSDRGEHFKNWLSQGQKSWEINIDRGCDCVPLNKSDFAADAFTKSICFNIRQSRSGALLCVKGVTVDNVKSVCELSGFLVDVNVEDFVNVILATGDQYRWTKEQPLVAAARTLTTDQCFKAGLSPDYIVQRLVMMLTTFLLERIPELLLKDWPTIDFGDGPRKIGHYDSYSKMKNAFPDLAWDKYWDLIDKDLTWEQLLGRCSITSTGRAPPADDRFIPLVVSATRGRSFFVTETGMTGLGPISTQPGDKVVLLRGSRVPFVMSPNHYHHRDRLKDLQYIEKSLTDVLNILKMHSPVDPSTRSDPHWNPMLETSLNSTLDELELFTDSRTKAHIFKGETYLHGFMHGEIGDLLEQGSVSWEELMIS